MKLYWLPYEQYAKTIKAAANLPVAKRIRATFAAQTVFNIQFQKHRRKVLNELRTDWDGRVTEFDIEEELRAYRDTLKRMKEGKWGEGKDNV